MCQWATASTVVSTKFSFSLNSTQHLLIVTLPAHTTLEMVSTLAMGLLRCEILIWNWKGITRRNDKQKHNWPKRHKNSFLMPQSCWGSTRSLSTHQQFQWLIYSRVIGSNVGMWETGLILRLRCLLRLFWHLPLFLCSKVLAATQTPGEGGNEWFQGTADAVRQYLWLFEVQD